MRAEGDWSQAGSATVLADASRYVEAGTLDLSGISRVDSSSVALLLELTRRAQQAGKTLHFTAAPAKLATLMAFFDVDELLPLQG